MEDEVRYGLTPTQDCNLASCNKNIRVYTGSAEQLQPSTSKRRQKFINTRSFCTLTTKLCLSSEQPSLTSPTDTTGSDHISRDINSSRSDDINQSSHGCQHQRGVCSSPVCDLTANLVYQTHLGSSVSSEDDTQCAQLHQDCSSEPQVNHPMGSLAKNINFGIDKTDSLGFTFGDAAFKFGDLASGLTCQACANDQKCFSHTDDGTERRDTITATSDKITNMLTDLNSNPELCKQNICNSHSGHDSQIMDFQHSSDDNVIVLSGLQESIKSQNGDIPMDSIYTSSSQQQQQQQLPSPAKLSPMFKRQLSKRKSEPLDDQFLCLPLHEESADDEVESEEDDDFYSVGSKRSDPCTPTTPKTRRLENYDPYQIFQVQHSPCLILKVCVLTGKNITLGFQDYYDTPDPYINLFMRSSPEGRKSTSVKENNINPVWNESFTFFLDFMQTNIMEITLMESNMLFDQKVGSVYFNIASIREMDRPQIETFIFNKVSQVDIEFRLEFDRNPTLRYSLCLSSQEKEFMERRKEKMMEGFRKLLGDEDSPINIDEVPTVAVIGSGGGFRAMTGYSGVFKALSESGVLDCSMYACGLSGSSWLLSTLYSHPKWPYLSLEEFVNELKNSVDESLLRFLNVTTMYKYVKFMIEKRKEGQPVSFTDIFGRMVGETLLKGRMEATLSDQRGKIKDGVVPMPLYTCVHVKKDVPAKSFQEWVEFSPYEIGMPKYGTFMDSELFGSKFFMGKLVKQYTEQPLHFLQGIWGSAFCILFKRLLEDNRRIDPVEMVRQELGKQLDEAGYESSSDCSDECVDDSSEDDDDNDEDPFLEATAGKGVSLDGMTTTSQSFDGITTTSQSFDGITTTSQSFDGMTKNSQSFDGTAKDFESFDSVDAPQDLEWADQKQRYSPRKTDNKKADKTDDDDDDGTNDPETHVMKSYNDRKHGTDLISEDKILDIDSAYEGEEDYDNDGDSSEEEMTRINTQKQFRAQTTEAQNVQQSQTTESRNMLQQSSKDSASPENDLVQEQSDVIQSLPTSSFQFDVKEINYSSPHKKSVNWGVCPKLGKKEGRGDYNQRRQAYISGTSFRKSKCGSKSYWNQLLKTIFESNSWELLSTRRGRAAVIHNFMRGLSLQQTYPLSPFTPVEKRVKAGDEFDGIFEMHSTSVKHIYMVDAGLTFNSPYPLVLRPQREVDIILSFDFSARDSDKSQPFKELLLAEKWARLNRLPFPPIDTSVFEREGMKELYIFRHPTDPHCPVVCHFVLVNDKFRYYKKPNVPRETKEEFEFAEFDVFDDPKAPFSTFNFTYTHKNFERMSQLMEFNTLLHIDDIKQVMKDAIRNKREGPPRLPIQSKDIKLLRMKSVQEMRKLRRFISCMESRNSIYSSVSPSTPFLTPAPNLETSGNPFFSGFQHEVSCSPGHNSDVFTSAIDNFSQSVAGGSFSRSPRMKKHFNLNTIFQESKELNDDQTTENDDDVDARNMSNCVSSPTEASMDQVSVSSQNLDRRMSNESVSGRSHVQDLKPCDEHPDQSPRSSMEVLESCPLRNYSVISVCTDPSLQSNSAGQMDTNNSGQEKSAGQLDTKTLITERSAGQMDKNNSGTENSTGQLDRNNSGTYLLKKRFNKSPSTESLGFDCLGFEPSAAGSKEVSRNDDVPSKLILGSETLSDPKFQASVTEDSNQMKDVAKQHESSPNPFFANVFRKRSTGRHCYNNPALSSQTVPGSGTDTDLIPRSLSCNQSPQTLHSSSSSDDIRSPKLLGRLTSRSPQLSPLLVSSCNRKQGQSKLKQVTPSPSRKLSKCEVNQVTPSPSRQPSKCEVNQVTLSPSRKLSKCEVNQVTPSPSECELQSVTPSLSTPEVYTLAPEAFKCDGTPVFDSHDARMYYESAKSKRKTFHRRQSTVSSMRNISLEEDDDDDDEMPFCDADQVCVGSLS